MKGIQFFYYLEIMRLNRPIGIFLLLWPTLMALWVASQGHLNPFIVGIFVAGVIVMRSAGCVINDFADRFFDKAVKRTEHRPLAKGVVSSKEALGLFGLLSVIAFSLVIQLNVFTILLSFVGLLLAILYPFTKRYTQLPQLVLGATFGWAVPMAFAAVKNQLSLSAFILYGATLCWTIAYDTQYAMVDKADDLKIGVKSTAILFGHWDKWAIFSLQLFSLGLLLSLGWIQKFGIYYYMGISCALVLALYQQYLIKDRKPEGCFKAFLNNNFFGAALWMGLVLEYGF